MYALYFVKPVGCMEEKKKKKKRINNLLFHDVIECLEQVAT